MSIMTPHQKVAQLRSTDHPDYLPIMESVSEQIESAQSLEFDILIDPRFCELTVSSVLEEVIKAGWKIAEEQEPTTKDQKIYRLFKVSPPRE